MAHGLFKRRLIDKVIKITVVTIMVKITNPTLVPGSNHIYINLKTLELYEVKYGSLWKLRTHKSNQGYLKFCAEGKTWSIHRVVCILCHGEPTPDRNICCHKDDDKGNNHPDNLYWGTYKSNREDAKKNGKMPLGTTSVLNEEQVMDIYRSEDSFVSIATTFGIHSATVSMIKNGRTWSHLTGKNPVPRKTVATIPDNIVKDIFLCEGSQDSIAKKYGTSQITVSRIKARRRYKEITEML